MYSRQLELGFGNGQKPANERTNPPPPTNYWQRRQRRAQWWFKQMRDVVDRALDRKPAPEPRPDQLWFSDRTHQARN